MAVVSSSRTLDTYGIRVRNGLGFDIIVAVVVVVSVDDADDCIFGILIIARAEEAR